MCNGERAQDHLMQQYDPYIYTHFNPILLIVHDKSWNIVCVRVCVFGGHARIQLLGMRLQLETTLHYLVLIKEAINSRCVKSITAASLRQNKHTALERENV